MRSFLRRFRCRLKALPERSTSEYFRTTDSNVRLKFTQFWAKLWVQSVCAVVLAAALVVSTTPAHTGGSGDQVNASLNAKSKDPESQDPEQARQTYLMAKEAEASAKSRAAQAGKVADDVKAKLLGQLTTNQGQYDDWAREESALKNQILQKFIERERYVLRPPVLTDEYAEYKRIYDVLVNYRQYVDDQFFRTITNRIDSLKREIQQAKDEADKKIAGVDKELAALQDRKKALDDRLPGIIALPVDSKLMGDWLKPLAEYGSAERDALEAEHELAAAFDRYMDLISKTSPPYLEGVVVRSEGQSEDIYAAEWVSDAQKPKSLADKAKFDLEPERIKERLAALDADIGEMEQTLREHASERLQLAEDMKLLTWDLETNIEIKNDFEVSKIWGFALIELGADALELLLSGGGVAAAAGKAGEVSEEAIKKAAESAVARVTGRPAGQAAAATENVTVEQLLAQLVLEEKKNAYSEMVKEAGRDFARNRLRMKEVYRQIARNTGLTGEAVEREAQAEADKLDRLLSPPVSIPTVNQPTLHGVEMRELEEAKKLAEKLELAETLERRHEGEQLMGSHVSTLLVEKTIGEKTIGEKLGPYAPIAVGNGLELLTNRFIKYGQLQFEENIKAAAGELPATATAWARFKEGVKGPKLSGSTFKQTILSKNALAALAASVYSAVLKSFFIKRELKLEESYEKKWEKLLEEYAEYYLKLKNDYVEIWTKRLQPERQQRAELRAYLNELRKPRSLNIKASRLVSESGKQLNVGLQFSVYLGKAPVVRLGGREVKMTPEGSPDSAQSWSGSLSVDDLPRGSDAAQLEVTLNPSSKPFSNLDSNPATPALLNTDGTWSGYETQADTNHTIRIKLDRPEPIGSDSKTEYLSPNGWVPAELASVHPAWPTLQGAQWIWKSNLVSSGEAMSGSAIITFRRRFTLPAQIRSPKGSIQITADNAYELSVNGHIIGSKGVLDASSNADQLWNSIDTYTVNFGPGDNLVEIRAINYHWQYDGVPTPQDNPAGVIFLITFQ